MSQPRAQPGAAEQPQGDRIDPAPMIRLEAVQKAFGGRIALHPLTLDVPGGGVFGLLGPNGAGKTTLLRIIMGLLPFDSGRITLFAGSGSEGSGIQGKQAGGGVPGDPAVTRRIGYMPQKLALYEGLSALENLRFYGRLYGLRGADLTQRCAALLERVELTPRAGDLTHTLSGGMLRRLMLATALVHRPRLLILDEPTAGVDPLLRARFWDWFADLSAEGVSILVTTHHIDEAHRCGEVLFLREGHLLDRGAPAALIRQYGADGLEDAFVRATRQALQPEGAA